MRYCKKISLFLVLMVASIQAFAELSSIAVKSAEIKAAGDAYWLSADLEITLDQEIEEAINKGVTVEFKYEFSVVQPRSYWFDKKIIDTETSIAVSYHALSRQYLVSQNGRQTSHEILREAMIELVQLYDWEVFERRMLKSGGDYIGTLKVRVDQTKLPKAIQVEAIGSKEWNLASEPFEWKLQNIK